MDSVVVKKAGMVNKEFQHHHAAHCESGAVTTLLRNNGFDLSEAMVFGIGSGLFFIHIPWVKLAGYPVTAYRDMPHSIIKNICKRLGVRMKSQRFRTPELGAKALDDLLEKGIPVGIQTNVYWLTYFPDDMRFHYNGHNIVVYGKQGNDYLISDPVSDHVVTCSSEDLQRARFSKGMLAPKGLIYYPEFIPENPDLEHAIPLAIRSTIKRMLDVPVPLMGVRGIRFLAKRMEKWPAKYGLKNAARHVGNVIRMQEEIGTGGAGFRFIYAAFLQESASIINNNELLSISQELSDVGDRWREFAVMGAQIVRQKEKSPAAYKNLAATVRECADGEEAVYKKLRQAVL
ncbi:MAG: BtrH N-terminal domain-containing protein [Acidiferrobacterales bacterium]